MWLLKAQESHFNSTINRHLIFLFRPLQFRGFLPLPPYLCAKFRDGYDFKTNEILYCSGFQLIFTLLFLYLLLRKMAMAKMGVKRRKALMHKK